MEAAVTSRTNDKTPDSRENLLYVHVQGEIGGANALYGLDEAPESAMPAGFWAEFPRRRGLRPRVTTSHVLNRLGAWGFRLVAFAPAVETHAEHLARLFYPNSIYLRPVSKYFPMFYWILCRDPSAAAAAAAPSHDLMVSATTAAGIADDPQQANDGHGQLHGSVLKDHQQAGGVLVDLDGSSSTRKETTNKAGRVAVVATKTVPNM
jgi:hypothetical protein